jgi:hypothetical protein
LAGTYIPKKRRSKTTKEERRLYRKEYQILNKDTLSHKKWLSSYKIKLKTEGINAYGGKCTCCGESRFEFLTLEHKGPVPKKPNGQRVVGFYAWTIARKLGWPSDTTILCYNCNCSKGVYGSCPHTWESPQ